MTYKHLFALIIMSAVSAGVSQADGEIGLGGNAYGVTASLTGYPTGSAFGGFLQGGYLPSGIERPTPGYFDWVDYDQKDWEARYCWAVGLAVRPYPDLSFGGGMSGTLTDEYLWGVSTATGLSWSIDAQGDDKIAPDFWTQVRVYHNKKSGAAVSLRFEGGAPGFGGSLQFGFSER